MALKYVIHDNVNSSDPVTAVANSAHHHNSSIGWGIADLDTA
jgi:hypothetical protein